MMDVVQSASEKYDADVVVYMGDIERPEDDYLIRQCRRRRRRKNVLLVLTTRGGDPSAAYRIARCFQRAYKTVEKSDAKTGRQEERKEGDFLVLVTSVCKSAGTILALGADKLFMSEHAELGPIDVQVRKPDEVGERTSGLTPIQALQFLENQSLVLFKRHFAALRFSDDLAFSTKMAADLATNITVGLLTPIYQQIDPIRLAEVDRFLRIASEYGERLGKNNLKDGALERLLVKYPSHGFVIDRDEANDLFIKVEEPCAELEELAKFFKVLADRTLDGDDNFVYFVSEEPPQSTQESASSGADDVSAAGGATTLEGTDGATEDTS